MPLTVGLDVDLGHDGHVAAVGRKDADGDVDGADEEEDPVGQPDGARQQAPVGQAHAAAAVLQHLD